MKRTEAYKQEFPGKMKGIVNHNHNGRTFRRKASFSYNKIPTAKQYIARERFITAHLFAQAVIADPVLKALYQHIAGNRCTAYNMAMSEYLLMREHGQWIF